MSTGDPPRPPRVGYFVTATGTGVGKTFFARALARAASAHSTVAAIKPIETGCDPDPIDALALARAGCCLPLARGENLYRHRLPLAPYAASLADGSTAPTARALATEVQRLAEGSSCVIVEGAGGLRVPLSATEDMTDLARALDLPLVLVATDELGVLSHVLTAVDAARLRELRLVAVVLRSGRSDQSSKYNVSILRERLAPTPVERFPSCADDDDSLAAALCDSSLGRLLLGPLLPS